MARLTPVDYDPFAQPSAGPRLVPVDGDPFAEAQEAPQRSLGGETVRQLGLTGRYALEGLGSAVGVFSDPIALAVPGANMRMGELATYAADKMGLPQPEGGLERVVGAATRAGVSALPTMGAGGVAAQAPGVMGRVGAVVAESPLAQTIAATTGGAAAETAKEMGAGPGGQTLAGLAGAIAPSAAAATARGLTRGGEAGRQNMLANIETYERAGTGGATVGQAAGNRRTNWVESLLGKAPGSSGVVAASAEAQQTGLGARAGAVANSLSTKSSPERAGRAIEQGIRGENGFVQAFKGKQEELFDQLDNFIPADRRISISGTTQALSELNAGIPGAPNTSRLFQNGRIAGIESALKKDVGITTDEQAALDKALSRIDELYASRDSATQTSGQLRALANQQANRADNFAPVPGYPRLPGRSTPFPDRANQANVAADEAADIARARASQAQGLEAAVSDLRAAAEAAGGKLPYEAIKKLRTLVGREMADAGLVSDVPRSKWKALYGALSRDLSQAASEAGPEATRAFTRANNYTRVGMGRLEALDSVIDKNGGPEAVFKAVMSGTREGGTTIRAVMQSLPKDAQKQVASAVVRRMGRAKPGSQDEMGEVFSSETFLTNWNTLSNEAKQGMFSRFGEGFVQDLNAIAKAAAGMRTGANVIKNGPGTAAAGAQFATAAGFVLNAFGGNPGMAGLIGGGVVSTYAAAKAMTNPTVVKWLAQQTKLPVAALPIQLARLKAEAQAKGDAEALGFANAVEQSAAEQPANR